MLYGKTFVRLCAIVLAARLVLLAQYAPAQTQPATAPAARQIDAQLVDVSSLALSADGKLFACGMSRGGAAKPLPQPFVIHLFDAASGERLRALEGHTDDVDALEFTSAGTLWSGSADGTVRLWDTANGRELHRFDRNTKQEQQQRKQQEQRTRQQQPAAGRRRGAQNVPPPPPPVMLPPPGGDFPHLRIEDLSISGSGQRVAVASGGRVFVYDLKSDSAIRIEYADEFVRHYVEQVALSPDGMIVVAGGGYADEKIIAYDVASSRVLREYDGHTDIPRSLAISPRAQQLAAGTRDGAVCLWDFRTGRRLRRIAAHGGPVDTLRFSTDGRLVLSAGEEDPEWIDRSDNRRSVRIWDAASGAAVASFNHDGGKRRLVAMMPDGSTVIGGMLAGSINVWDGSAAARAARTRPPQELPPDDSFGGTFRQLAKYVAPSHVLRPDDALFDGRKLVSLHSHASVIRWNVQTGKPLATKSFEVRDPHDRNAVDVIPQMFTPDGTLAVFRRADGPFEVRDARTGAIVRRIAAPRPKWWELDMNEICPPQLSPDGRLLAATSVDQDVTIYDVAKGNVVHRLPRHENPPRALAFSPDGKRLATGTGAVSLDSSGEPISKGAGLCTWDIASGQLISRWDTMAVTLAFAPDGSRLLVANDNGVYPRKVAMTRLLDARNGEAVFEIPGGARCFTFAPSGRRFASGGHDSNVTIRDAATGNQLARFGQHAGPIVGIRFAPDEKTLLSWSDEALRLWKLSG